MPIKCMRAVVLFSNTHADDYAATEFIYPLSIIFIHVLKCFHGKE